MPRGGRRIGAGRPRSDQAGKHSAYRYLDADGEAAMDYLAKTAEFKGAPFWYVVGRALAVLRDIRQFDDPAHHLEAWKARDYEPWDIRGVIRRYQRMCAGVDQKVMAELVGVNQGTFNGYVNKAESVPRVVLGRARAVCRELCLGRDPDLTQHGRPVAWPREGIREGLAGERSTLTPSLEDWAVCRSLVEVRLRGQHPAGLRPDDVKGPTFAAWKLLPADCREAVVHLPAMVEPDGRAPGVIMIEARNAELANKPTFEEFASRQEMAMNRKGEDNV